MEKELAETETERRSNKIYNQLSILLNERDEAKLIVTL